MGRQDALFGEWLKERRRALDLTQEDLADRIGCSPVTILKIERGTRRPSKQLAELLADHLNIPLEERTDFLRLARSGKLEDGDSASPRSDVEELGQHPPNNLHPQPTTFVGREQETAALRALLMRADVRLITLTGAGGVGKTRLAIQVAAELLDAFSDGTFFVALAPVSSPDLVVSAIAQTLGHRKHPAKSLLESLKDYLREKQMLLFLDNFEHLEQARLPVAELLAATRVKIIVTSRAALHIYGEHVFAVRPLSLPPVGMVREPLVHVQRLAEYEAVRLFVQRSQAAKSGFTLTSENAPFVAEICRRLDGLPLAIELAASRINLFSPKNMLSRLASGEHLAMLTTGAADLPARQRTLRGAIAWSYDLLEKEERTLFRRIAAFVGGCSLEAMERVVIDDPLPGTQYSLLDVLGLLVDKSLLRQEEGAGEEPRFSMLETIRDYALEQLATAEPEEETATRSRHADYFLQMAEQGEQELRGPQQALWLDKLEQEHDNLRAALAWTLREGSVEIALRMSGAMWQFWWLHGHMVEGRGWLDAALGRARAFEHGAEIDPALLAKTLNAAGSLAGYQSDYMRAETLLNESLAIRRTLGDKQGIANSLNNLGTLATGQGHYEQATMLFEESLALGRALGDKKNIAMSLNNLGNIALNTGDYHRATPFYKESLAIARSLRDRQNIALSLGNLGLVALYQDDYDTAGPLLSESLALGRELGNSRVVAVALNSLSCIASSKKDYQEARALTQKSLALYRDLGNHNSIADCLESLAEVDVLLGQTDPESSIRAAVLLGAQTALRESLGYPLTPFGRPLYEQTVAGARSQLDKAAWENAWARGQSMNLEEIIAYALADV